MSDGIEELSLSDLVSSSAYILVARPDEPPDETREIRIAVKRPSGEAVEGRFSGRLQRFVVERTLRGTLSGPSVSAVASGLDQDFDRTVEDLIEPRNVGLIHLRYRSSIRGRPAGTFVVFLNPCGRPDPEDGDSPRSAYHRAFGGCLRFVAEGAWESLEREPEIAALIRRGGGDDALPPPPPPPPRR